MFEQTACTYTYIGIKMFAENLNCLKKAWMLAKGKLKDQGRSTIISKYNY